MPAGDELILLTGATSFICSHVINLLLQEGYKVRGTVRSLTSAKTKAVREIFSAYADKLELVEADLKRSEGWDEACKGCTFVVHTACPVEMETFAKDPMNRVLKEPAEVDAAIKVVVDGTLFVINAAKNAGVKRVVMTSSIAAMIPSGFCEAMFPFRNVPGVYDPQAYLTTIDESTWSNEKLVDGYLRAKTVSERVAWQAVEGSSTQLVCINPAVVTGPQLHARICCDSSAMVDIAMKQPPDNPKSLPAMPSMVVPTIDVRDVAKAHVIALFAAEAAGNRYLLVNRLIDSLEYEEICAELFKPMGYQTLGLKMPKCVVGLLSPCDPLMARIYNNWGKYPKVDNAKLLRELVPDLIDLKTSIEDTVLASVAVGRYERKPGFKTSKPEYQGTAQHISLKASLA